MPLYAVKYAICAFLQNMRNMLRSHDRYKPLSLSIASSVELVVMCKIEEKNHLQQNQLALPRAKYCLWVAAENTKKSCDLDLWPMTLKLDRVLEVVKVHIRAIYIIKLMCSGLWVIVTTNFFALSRNDEKSENPVHSVCVWDGLPVQVYVCMSLCLCVSVCLCVCLYVCVCLSVCLCQSVCMYVCMSVCLSMCLSVCLSVCMSVCLSVCSGETALRSTLSVFETAYLSKSLSLCLSVCLCVSVCLSMCLSVCMSVCMLCVVVRLPYGPLCLCLRWPTCPSLCRGSSILSIWSSPAVLLLRRPMRRLTALWRSSQGQSRIQSVGDFTFWLEFSEVNLT